ncbi:hypothetical protein [Paenibacillus athensensis]|uniref:Apea-like HEPN domain-containing protein n=1 Tax=Paenibacillus athensensis TaxID=1967502 RepID=A0A4Y8Q4X8_9BACL|nr:hypothetical protein [Paenibacillus athensensis]
MKERMLLVLSDHENHNQKEIIKKLNDFYQYRSNFVHGNLDIYIPSELILEREEHESYAKKLMQTEELAFKVLIATLQKMINEGWHSFNFTTTFHGK